MTTTLQRLTTVGNVAAARQLTADRVREAIARQRVKPKLSINGVKYFDERAVDEAIDMTTEQEA